MDMTLEQLLVQRDELEKNINSGVLEVRFGERWFKYQSTGDMQKALTSLDNRIAVLSSPSGSRSMCNFTEFNG
jgi:hypothetical protein